MHRLPLWIGLSCLAWAVTSLAQEMPPLEAPPPKPQAPLVGDTELVWSLGESVAFNDLRHPDRMGTRLMIGLRYGRWRSGVVDGDTWHRFGQLQSDNNLTYDVLNAGAWRTSLSGSVVNLQRDSRFDAFQSGRKTLRGKGTIDYLGWPHWSAGLVVKQDLLGRGAGTSLTPSITYRKAVSNDSTLLFSHALTWSRSDQWRYTQQNNPAIDLEQPSRWGLGMDTSLTLRQRWKPHWSWFAQLNRSQLMRAGDPTAHSGQVFWSGQVGLVYFQH